MFHHKAHSVGTTTVSLMLATLLFGCDRPEPGPEVSDPVREVREQVDLVPEGHEDPAAAENAAELREEIGLHEKGEDPQPETPQELRKEMDLHPDPPPKAE